MSYLMQLFERKWFLEIYVKFPVELRAKLKVTEILTPLVYMAGGQSRSLNCFFHTKHKNGITQIFDNFFLIGNAHTDFVSSSQ